MLVERICDEVLRHLYAFSTRRWAEALTELALVGLAATFVIAAWRFRDAGPHGPRPTQPGREDA